MIIHKVNPINIRKCPLTYIPKNSIKITKITYPRMYSRLRSVAIQKLHVSTHAYPLNNHITYQNTEFKTPVNGEYLYLPIPIITKKHNIT